MWTDKFAAIDRLDLVSQAPKTLLLVAIEQSIVRFRVGQSEHLLVWQPGYEGVKHKFYESGSTFKSKFWNEFLLLQE